MIFCRPVSMALEKNLSTTLALLDLVDKLTTSIENNEITIGIFVDLAKAFDTVNHNKIFYYLNYIITVSGVLPMNGLKAT